MTRHYRVSADIGGTFTDIVYQDCSTGACGATKLLSTPDDPALAVLRGIEAAIPPEAAIDFFVHGTTVGLNALLTRRGAKVALLTTENFRDIYTIQGNDRGEIFSIRWNKPEPLAPLEHTFTARERIAATGEVVTPLDTGDLDRLVDAVTEEGFEAIAIAFLFSFKNPTHELEAAEYLAARLPDVPIGLSHRVSPEWREFERTSTTVMNSYLAPVVRRYLETLIGGLSDRLPRGRGLHVMQSNGGVMTAESASETPLQTLLSGPVGGAIGGRALSAATGRPNLICIDMGGTSFDASLIIDGLPSGSNEAKLEGLPVQMSVVDIHVIGAGGGSIAWEEAGAMRVGPQSAGSMPGPACYGLGGTEPTVSDANLVLGRLDGANFSGGEMALYRDAAVGALQGIGDAFGLATEAMAQGVVDVVNAKMADAIRTITVQRGIDPRDFSLVAFGGAGPAQAGALAEELQIREVIVPVHPAPSRPGACCRRTCATTTRRRSTASGTSWSAPFSNRPSRGSRRRAANTCWPRESPRTPSPSSGPSTSATTGRNTCSPSRFRRGPSTWTPCERPSMWRTIGSMATPARRTALRWRIFAWPRSVGWRAPIPPRPRRSPRERHGRAMSFSPAGQ